MPSIVASVIFAIGIVGLFYLVRDDGPPMSKGLWIPAAWLLIIGSRPVSYWFGMTPTIDSPAGYLEGSPFDRALFAVLIIAAFAVVISRRNLVAPVLASNKLVLLFFLFCAVSILWSDFPFVALKRWTKSLGDLLMVLIIVTEPDPKGALKRLATRLAFLLFPLSILFTKYYPQIGRRLTNSWTMETVGVALQKNGLGEDCMVYGIIFLSMFWSVYRDREDPSRRRRLLAYGTIIGMIVWLLHSCNSLTSMSGLAMAAGVMWLARRPLRKPALVHLAVVAVVGISLIALFADPGGNLVEALGRDRTFSGRTLIWSLVLARQPNPWVGAGFESFWLGDRAQAIWDALPNLPITSAHSGYVEVYLNLGWVGIGLLALLLLLGYRRVIALVREAPPTGSLLLGLFLAALFESLTEAAFRMMSTAWIFLLLVIIGSSKVLVAEPSVGWEPSSLSSNGQFWPWAAEDLEHIDESEIRIS